MANATQEIESALIEGRQITVAIDSNCYGGSRSVSLKLTELNLLAKAVKSDGVRVVFPEAWGFEMTNHIKSTIVKEVKEPLEVGRDTALLINDENLTQAMRELRRQLADIHRSVEVIAAEIWLEHKRKLSSDSPVDIPTPQDAAARALLLYKPRSAPFAADKENEFIDCFSLFALEDYAAQNKILIVVASLDGPCRNYCNNSEHLAAVESLQALIDLLGSKVAVLARHAKLLAVEKQELQLEAALTTAEPSAWLRSLWATAESKLRVDYLSYAYPGYGFIAELGDPQGMYFVPIGKAGQKALFHGLQKDGTWSMTITIRWTAPNYFRFLVRLDESTELTPKIVQANEFKLEATFFVTLVHNGLGSIFEGSDLTPLRVESFTSDFEMPGDWRPNPN